MEQILLQDFKRNAHSRKKIILDLDRLKHAYLNERSKRISDIAAEFNVSIPTIRRNLRKIIPKSMRRNGGWKYNKHNPLNKRILRLYLRKKLSCKAVSEIIFGTPEKDETVREILKGMGIQRRHLSFKNLNYISPKSFSRKKQSYNFNSVKELNAKIKELYLKKNLTLENVGKELGIHKDTVRKRLAFMGIPLRKITLSNEKIERNEGIVKNYLKFKKLKILSSKHNLSIDQIRKILKASNVKVKRQKKDYLENKLLCSKIKIMHLERKMSIQDIAKEMNVCWNTVKKHLVAMRIKNKRYNNFGKQIEFNEDVKRLYVYEGLNGHQVAERLNCSAPKVYKRLKYLGIKVRNAAQYFTEKEKKRHKRVIFWYKKGLAIPSISKIEKMPQSTIFYLLNRNGIKMRRKGENSNQKAIVFMALRNPKKYMQYAEMRINNIKQQQLARKTFLSRRKELMKDVSIAEILDEEKGEPLQPELLIEV